MTAEQRESGSGPAPDWRCPAAVADPRVELAAVRTGLALERTRMSADRTLMAVMRTGLALIGIGFAVFEYFHAVREALGTTRVFSLTGARNVGFSLVALGLGVLGPGIVAHRVFLRRLQRQRDDLAGRGLVPPELDLPGSIASVLAILLFALGIVAILRMALRAGLFG
jgi:putative membrane protein